jgi:hypothetical protein
VSGFLGAIFAGSCVEPGFDSSVETEAKNLLCRYTAMRYRLRLILSAALAVATALILTLWIMSVWRAVAPIEPALQPEQVNLTMDERDELSRQRWAEREEELCKLWTQRLDKEEERGPIRCRLRALPRKAGDRDQVDIAIVNVGAKPHRFWHTIFGLCEHVTMFLREPEGRVVADMYWATFSSHAIHVDPATGRPIRDEPVRELRAGAAELHPVYLSVLLSSHVGAKIPPGRYVVQVTFHYSDLGGFPEANRDLFARSEQVAVELDADGLRLVRD